MFKTMGYEKVMCGGQPSGIVVKFAHSTSGPRVRWFRSWEQTYTLLLNPCCSSVPHTKWRKIGTNVSSATIFRKQKEEDWQQVLAQGQSSSPKNPEITIHLIEGGRKTQYVKYIAC